MNYVFQNHVEPGLAIDSVKMLTMKLNPSHIWLQSFALSSSYSHDETYINSQLDLFSSPDPSLLLFVFLSKAYPVCFLTHKLTAWFRNDFSNFTFSNFLSSFDNIEQLKNDLLTHYLGPQSYSNIDYEPLIRRNSSIPDKIKMLLFGFMLNPPNYVKLLKKHLNMFYNSFETSNRNLQNTTLDESLLLSILNTCIPTPKEFLSEISDPLIRYSVCTSVPNHLQFGHSSSLWIVFTEHYLNSLAISTDILPSEYLNVLSEALRNKSRTTILSLFQQHSTLQISELESLTNLATSTLLHHLHVLKKARVITEKKEGKISIYSINSDSLLYGAKILTNLAKGASS